MQEISHKLLPRKQSRKEIESDKEFVRNWQNKAKNLMLTWNLHNMMDRAVAREDYEFAAECRDALKEVHRIMAESG